MSKTASEVKIRFNNLFADEADPDLKWRVLENGIERLARSVAINVRSWTSRDLLPSGIEKWHVSCHGKVVWDGETVSINPETHR